METIDFTGHPAAGLALAIFVLAYAAVVVEEWTGLRKSIPVLVAGGLMWVLVGLAYAQAGHGEAAAGAARRTLLDYGELFLFLVVAMTYVNTLDERGVFNAARVWLVGRGLSLRALFWATGALAFAISPVVNNLTNALVLGSVAIALGQGRPRFVAVACINIVVAANAGGVFSPFGDITTLMVWQKGVVPFGGFFALFIPALVNWLVPAALLAHAVEKGQPQAVAEKVALEAGALTVVLLFLTTIALTVFLHGALQLPPALGMMLGLGLLKLYSYGFNRLFGRQRLPVNDLDDVFASPQMDINQLEDAAPEVEVRRRGRAKPIQTFALMERVEWDTLMFFYGVVLGVGALGALGYLDRLSRVLYAGLGPTAANLLVGLLSAVVDNVPVMFAVLSMNPPMPEGEWLLVTLATGVGGSLLSLGSAAGVALMGQARGVYTFRSHLKWSWAVALGYAAAAATHLLLNRHLF
jgi:Na+/H+ antiporter NhaD/arsenite permease-like protein